MMSCVERYKKVMGRPQLQHKVQPKKGYGQRRKKTNKLGESHAHGKWITTNTRLQRLEALTKDIIRQQEEDEATKEQRLINRLEKARNKAQVTAMEKPLLQMLKNLKYIEGDNAMPVKVLKSFIANNKDVLIELSDDNFPSMSKMKRNDIVELLIDLDVCKHAEDFN